jgi:tRNA1(Val) A37 N6-methylase TrmN6
MAAFSADTRALFPSGLIQPAGSFRFSLDALLLASFTLHCLARCEGSVHLLDLGCGCGVAGLACLLEREDATAKGADREPELVTAAGENAACLGVESRYGAVCCDFGDAAARMNLAAEKADAVLANMPYRPENSGRLPRSAMRRRAFFADETTMPSFLQAAKAAVKPEGIFTLIYPWAGREVLFSGIARYGFVTRTVLPVCTADEEKKFCLVCAGQANAGEDILSPLVLRGGKGGAYTAEALSFCPWL